MEAAEMGAGMAKRQRRKRQERRRRHAHRDELSLRRSVITGSGLAAGVVLGIASPANAAVIYVDRTDDPSLPAGGNCTPAADDCSLRGAITLANTNGQAYDYVFLSGLSGTISLTTAAGGEIPITRAVYLYGDGADQLTIAAAPNSRIFNIDQATPDDGVGIYELTLSGGNVAGNGGAILNLDAYLVLTNSVLSGNTASGNGGAIYEAGADTYNGYYTFISRSTFSGNTAANGGAIYAANHWGLIEGSTFSGNTATAPSGQGGALYAGLSSSIFDSTLSGNTAAGAGSGIYVSASLDALYNTIVANGNGSSDVHTSGTSYGSYNLVENPGSTVLSGANNITGVDPQLGALGANGGYTPTLKPAASSPVVDKGYSNVSFDQRFFARTVDNPNVANAPGGDGTDIGSVELTLMEGPQAPPPGPGPTPTPTPAPTPPTFNLKQAIKKCKKKFPRGPRRKKCIKKAKAKATASALPFSRSAARRWNEPAGRSDHPFRLYRR